MIEHAQGGTLFLDEVDSLSSKAQVTLLRFLQDSEYRPVGSGIARAADVRVIAATNACLLERVESEVFRRDLLYRLNALHVRMPALRERGDDILLLAERFLVSATDRLGLPSGKCWSAAAKRLLLNHAWPGNVRELDNVVLRACLLADGECVDSEHLIAAEPAMESRRPDGVFIGAADTSFCAAKNRAIENFERDYLTSLMRRTAGNVSEAARVACTERRHLGKLLKKHGIGRTAFRAD